MIWLPDHLWSPDRWGHTFFDRFWADPDRWAHLTTFILLDLCEVAVIIIAVIWIVRIIQGTAK